MVFLFLGCLTVTAVFCFAAFMIWRELSAPLEMSGRVLEWKSQGTFFSWQVRTEGHVRDGEHSIFYVSKGAKEQRGPHRVLLLVHGYPTSSFDWHRMMPSLEAYAKDRSLHLLALDLLGFGFSEKPTTLLPSKQDLGEQIHAQANVIEDLLLHVTDAGDAIQLDILCHDYGDTVCQELLYRATKALLPPTVTLRSIMFLNGGMTPDLHKPILLQKLLAAPVLGSVIGRCMTRSTFGPRFSSIFGPLTQPSSEELDEHWTLLCHNQGKMAQSSLIKYMEQRRKHKERWLEGLRKPQKVAWCMVDGPADPISGQHMANAIAEIGNCPAYAWGEKKRGIVPFVQLLQERIGHYPQLEAPAAVLKEFIAFQATIE